MKHFILPFLFLIIAHTVTAQCTPEDYDIPDGQADILAMMNIPCAWELIENAPIIPVGLMDSDGTSSDFNHNDLAGKVSFLAGHGCNNSDLVYDHLLGMMGIIAGIKDNEICGAGVNENTKLYPYCGPCSKTGIEYLISLNKGIEVIVCSAAAVSNVTNADFENWTTNDGITFLVAGLNQGHEAADPNGYHSVPGVLHVGRAFQNGDFNQYGSDPNLNLDVLIITEKLHKLDNNHETDCRESFGGGTSIGTPLLAGVVTLLKSVDACLTPSQIEQILINTARPVPLNAPTGTTSAGVINAEAAVQAAINGYGLHIYADQELTTGYLSDLTIQNIGTVVTIPADNDLAISDNGIITIQPGTTLEINGPLDLGQNAKIIVKRGARLIIDGAHLTTSDCATEWTGIEVEGNIWEEQQTLGDLQQTNKNGIVQITNSTLENANTVVSMYPDHVPRPNRKYHYGGLVQAEKTTFKNNRRAVEFMQYRVYDDKSYFIDCAFDGHHTTATHWNNRGVEYRNCIFTNHENIGIHSYNAAIELNGGNEFHNTLHWQSDQAGVLQTYTYAYPHPSMIGNGDGDPNLFLGGYFGLRAIGNINADFNSIVTNNIFIGSTNGARFEGITNVDLVRNDFFDNTISGASLLANGSYANFHNFNNFSNAYYGMYYHGNNSETQFQRNCFQLPPPSPIAQYQKDIYMIEADIADMQGTSTTANSNLFSEALGRRGMDAFDSPMFTYFVQEDRDQLDRQAPFSVSAAYDIPFPFPSIQVYYINFDSEFELPAVCGLENLDGDEQVTNIPCPIPSDEDELNLLIDILKNDIADYYTQLENLDPFSSDWYTTYAQIAHLSKCLQNALFEQMNFHGTNKDFTNLINVADHGEQSVITEEFLYKPIAFGYLMFHGEYDLAENYINSWVDISEEIVDYKYAQNINIRYLKNEETFILSENERQELYAKSIKQFPLSAHIRSLYYVLTGELNSYTIIKDTRGGENSNGRSNKSSRQKIKVYPNPIVNELNLFNLPLGNIAVEIYSMQGHKVSGVTLDKSSISSIDIADLSKGVYILYVRDLSNGKMVHTEKVIKF